MSHEGGKDRKKRAAHVLTRSLERSAIAIGGDERKAIGRAMCGKADEPRVFQLWRHGNVSAWGVRWRTGKSAHYFVVLCRGEGVVVTVLPLSELVTCARAVPDDLKPEASLYLVRQEVLRRTGADHGQDAHATPPP